MNYLSAEAVSKSFGDRWLFKNLSFGISRGEKIALVGLNGSGKTTLLNVLAGLMPPDEGLVSVRKGVTVGYLGQEPVFEETKTVLDTLFSAQNPSLQAIKFYEASLAADNAHLPEAIERMDALKAWDYEVKVKQILGTLGIREMDQPISQLSGGQRKRVAMARVLIEEPDLLIMDEPTNHLDLETIEWLENALATQQQALLLVSHDRYFLDRACNQIVELDNGKLFRYQGNYAYFLEKKAERELANAAEIDKAKNLMRKELEWMRRQPKARGTKAQYRIDAFHELKDKASQKKTDSALELSVKTTRQGGKIIEVNQLSKSFGAQTLVKDFSYVFRKKDRIGIVGRNGVGKTTFLNLLTGGLPPDSGRVDKGDTTTFGYYSQTALDFREDQRVIDLVKEIAEVVTMGNGETITASQFLQHFQFPPTTQYKFVSKLSGGEKRRLQLLKVLIQNPNFLILDEPTNDLDIATLNILEDFLSVFPGCLLLVSHDRYFMDHLVEHLFVFEGEGKVRDFPGNYTDYREWLAEQEAEAKPDPVKRPAPTNGTHPAAVSVAVADKKKLSHKEKREYESLEREIETLEKQKAGLVQRLNAGSTNHAELTAWAREIGELDG
ncbi:MAG: ABC-F family ATP-binding cassette domain-containing protein, partial [Ferruginibacter sp.]|nr:ABC-F family ATP-binding cassette domain-containing protein [Cytophagales bacterium]